MHIHAQELIEILHRVLYIGLGLAALAEFFLH